MKIAFLVPGTEGRPLPINGHTTRYGNAPCSGTEQSVILVAEYLAKNGYDITIVIDKTDFETVNNVKYTDFSYKGMPGEIDVLVTMLYFAEYDKLPFKVNNKVIHWFHMAWGYGIRELNLYCKTNNLPLKLVNPSAFAQFHNTYSYELHHGENVDVSRYIIPNAVDKKLINEVRKENIEKDPNKIIFHAQFSRGGAVVKEALKQFDNNFYIKHFDYVEKESAVGKLELLRELASASYFVFPLYHPNGCTYKDTFSCAVAEAIAMDVKVITYPLGAFPEHFSGLIHYANFPPGVDINKLYKDRVSCDVPQLQNPAPIVEALKKAEELGKDFIPNLQYNSINFVNFYSDDMIGKYWQNIIN